jgi:hypothetical protein
MQIWWLLYAVVDVYNQHTYTYVSFFGGLVVSMLASGTQDRGFEPGQSRQIFQVKKSTSCLPFEGK